MIAEADAHVTNKNEDSCDLNGCRCARWSQQSNRVGSHQWVPFQHQSLTRDARPYPGGCFRTEVSAERGGAFSDSSAYEYHWILRRLSARGTVEPLLRQCHERSAGRLCALS